MLKNIMFWFLTACAAIRLGGLGFVLWTGSSNLPVTTMVLSAVTGILMLAFAGKKYLFGCKRSEMEIIFIANSAVVFFNTIYVKFTSLSTLGFVDIMIVGTMFEILAGATFIFLSKRRTKYITIPHSPQE